MLPPIPSDEQARLAALHGLGMLGTPLALASPADLVPLGAEAALG